MEQDTVFHKEKKNGVQQKTMSLKLAYYPLMLGMWVCFIIVLMFALVGFAQVVTDKVLTQSQEQLGWMFFFIMPIIMLILPFYLCICVKPKSFAEIKEEFNKWKLSLKTKDS